MFSNTPGSYCKKSASFNSEVKFTISTYILQTKKNTIKPWRWCTSITWF